MCYTLSIIQHNIPHFRHNDLKPNNIVIHKNKLSRNSYTEYSILNKEYLIKNRGYTIKIIDYDLSYGSNFKNKKITTFKKTNYKKIGYSPAINPVFDIHFFMITMYKLLYRYMNINKQLKQILNRMNNLIIRMVM